jgi:hypothetical protein
MPLDKRLLTSALPLVEEKGESARMKTKNANSH